MSQSCIVIIDYGMGNLHSIAKALVHVAPNARVLISADPHCIAQADRVVLPGVGAIGDCMLELKHLGLDAVVNQVIAQRQPLLGICVGMQMLAQHSEENGGTSGLGHLPFRMRRFQAQPPLLKVPHMGWNTVEQHDHPLWRGIDDHSYFYFVHSYCAQTDHAELVSGYCQYGHRFAAALAWQSIFATQFHPEKSADNGLQLLSNFARWEGQH